VTGLQVLTWAVVIIAGAIVVLGGTTGISRVRRQRRAHRRERLRDELRPGIVAILADPDGSHQLPIHRGRRADLFGVLAFDYLAKVRGESRDALVRVLDERGTVVDAERRTRRPGTVGRSGAAELLGRCGLAHSRPALERLLTSRSKAERAVAVRALGHLGDPAAAPALLEVARARSVPAPLICQAVVRLGPEAQGDLITHLRSRSIDVQRVTVDALGLLQSVDAVERLITLLPDRDLELVVRTARALGRIGDPRAVAPLLELLDRSPEWPVVAVVARALGELGSPSAAPILIELLGHERPPVATNAATALVQLGRAGADALAAAVEGDEPNPYAAAALSRQAILDGGAP
jgi:hypothetical protein